jgi:hypothetical protein
MLAACSRALLSICGTVTVMARDDSRIRAIAPAVVPLACDYAGAGGIKALDGQSPDLVVAWIHGRMAEFRLALARCVRPGGRFVHVLGSAHGDPSKPERLADMKALVDGSPLFYQAVVLGFAMDGARARWLADAEISAGVFAAIEGGRPLTIVGTVEPWSARP